ncbi:MAG: hypothetical protein HY835_08150 [Anaerolineae bacterium]|nr:hypothetical protein [Anaerolineae bacterium]
MAGGWKLSQDDSGGTEYANGGLRIWVNTDTTDFFTVPGLNFTDVQIEVDVTKAAGPDDSDYGVLCRYQNENNFYFFKITGDGYYAIGKFKDNVMSLVGMQEYQISEDIAKGTSLNHLRADCNGSTLALSANGKKLVEVQDGDFSSGDVGLIAGTFSAPGTDIYFDNFTVIKP